MIFTLTLVFFFVLYATYSIGYRCGEMNTIKTIFYALNDAGKVEEFKGVLGKFISKIKIDI